MLDAETSVNYFQSCVVLKKNLPGMRLNQVKEMDMGKV